MTAVVISLVVLGCGAASSPLLLRRPRLGLLTTLMSIAIAAMLCLGAAWSCLAHGGDAGICTMDWPMAMGTARLALDGLSAWFLLTLSVLSLTVAIYSWSYLQSRIGRGSAAALGAALCMLIAAMILVVTAADVVLFLVGWELMMLGSFFLISFHHRDAEVRRAAWIYLIANHLGTALFVVPLFGVLAAKAGTLDIHAFPAALRGADPATCVMLFILGLLGFGTKAGFMPMHIWLPVAHPAAPTPVSALLSGVVIKMGIYGLLRLLGWLPSLPAGCAVAMLLFGAVSGVMGVLYALAQHDIKRLLAYHSVENIGIIGLGIGMGMLGQTLGLPALVALGYGGALLHVLNHALFKGLLFLSAGAVTHAAGTGDIERLGGLMRKTPINAALFLIAAVSICGLPPLNGFVSEWLLYGSLFGGASSAPRAAAGAAAIGALCLALMGGLALACFAKVFSVVFLGEPRDASIHAHPTPTGLWVAMLIPASLCVWIGLLPGTVFPMTAGGLNALTGMTRDQFDMATHAILAPAAQLTGMAAVWLGVLAALGFLRRAALRRNLAAPLPAASTWGCGYASPSASMQYTASSFAWPLIQSFRHLLWPDRTAPAPSGAFAGRAGLESHVPDLAEHDVFAPLLSGLARAFRMIQIWSWTGDPGEEAPRAKMDGRVGPLRTAIRGVATALRRGSIHVYMAFIAATLLTVFLAEALRGHGQAVQPATPAVRSIDGVPK